MKQKKELLDREDFLNRHRQLDNTRKMLKREFYGIDTVIDQVINNLAGWYCFNSFQDRPLIINLWGLTGTGKTSLVKQIVKLLKLDRGFFQFDMRSNSMGELSDITDAIFHDFKGKPFVLLLDEFQQGKTIDEKGQSRRNSYQLPIWELLDSGRISVEVKSREAINLYSVMRECSHLLDQGGIVQNGYITYDPRETEEEKNDTSYRYTRNHYRFVKHGDYCSFVELCPERFNTELDVEETLLAMDGKETINLIREVLHNAYKPREIDATKSLIFVSGNIDSAYLMSASISPEDDADAFHKMSQKITVVDIKKSLSQMFRKEQISRLGSNHIIYPSLSRDAYYQIIERELNLLAVKFQKFTNVAIQYDQSMKKMLYEEGVFPAQGTRPLLSAIRQIVGANFPSFIMDLIKTEGDVELLKVSSDKGRLSAEFYNNNTILNKSYYSIALSIDRVRREHSDDLRYVYSVHEAGHALAYMILFNQIPERASSLSFDSDYGGSVNISKPKSQFKDNIEKWIAVHIAGGVAEQLVFGESHLPMGTFHDHIYVTNLVVGLLKEGVINEIPGVYQHVTTMTNSYLKSDHDRFTKQAEEMLKDAKVIALDSLKNKQKPLLALADLLIKNDYLSKKDLSAFAEKHLQINVESLSKGIYQTCFNLKYESAN